MIVGSLRIAILVGAGASFGAFDASYSRPTLGDDLFTKLVAKFPETWGELPAGVAASFTNDGFENGMAALRAEGKATQRALIDMGGYFGTFNIPEAGTNRYVDLVSMLDDIGPRCQYIFASLNYENLLEQSLDASGHDVAYVGLNQRRLSRSILVIKPHGSANFSIDPMTNTFSGMTFLGQGTYVSGLPLTVVPNDQIYDKALRSGFPPAMSLYAPGKPDLVCPEQALHFREEWARAIEAANLIVVLGARPMLASDPHIWNPIIKSNAGLVLIGSADDELERQCSTRITNLGSKFEGAVEPLRRLLNG